MKSRNSSEPRTEGGVILSEEMVSKVGAAVGRLAVIQTEYSQRVDAADDQSAKRQLADRARHEAVQAISDQGLTVDEYNEVVGAAEGDADLEERLLSAARIAI